MKDFADASIVAALEDRCRAKLCRPAGCEEAVYMLSAAGHMDPQVAEAEIQATEVLARQVSGINFHDVLCCD